MMSRRRRRGNMVGTPGAMPSNKARGEILSARAIEAPAHSAYCEIPVVRPLPRRGGGAACAARKLAASLRVRPMSADGARQRDIQDVNYSYTGEIWPQR